MRRTMPPPHPGRSRFLKGERIRPKPIGRNVDVRTLVEGSFFAYNAGRLRDGCELFVEKMLRPEVTVGMSLTGALSAAGLTLSCLVPLVRAGFVDWIVSTGANLYHDAHFGMGLALHRGSPFFDDVRLRDEGVIRIYDVVFDYDVLLSTDAFLRDLLSLPEFRRDMGTAEMHYRLGAYLTERERALGIRTSCLLSAAYQAGVPVYTSSPGDSSIGMNVAALAIEGRGPRLDVSLDVNETAALVLAAKRRPRGKSAVVILGGGSPKNFILQTEPQIQEVLGIPEKGHDFFLQVTDARPDTGGLSGATPAEAVSWGKIDPDQLPDSVVCYLDTTVALPLLTAYALQRRSARPLKRLYDRRSEALAQLTREAARHRLPTPAAKRARSRA